MSREPTDDEIIARDRENYRAMTRFRFWLFGSVTAVLVLLGFALSIGISNQVALGFKLAIPALIVVGVGWIYLRYRPAKEAQSFGIVRKQIDEHHARWRFAQGALLVALLLMAINASGSLQAPFGFVAVVLIYALTACFGPAILKSSYWRALNDELTLALRAKSITVGYLIVMAMLALLYLVIYHSPYLALLLAPFFLVAGVAVPTVYFFILQWHAGRDH